MEFNEWHDNERDLDDESEYEAQESEGETERDPPKLVVLEGHYGTVQIDTGLTSISEDFSVISSPAATNITPTTLSADNSSAAAALNTVGKRSGLLRLLESDLFDANMALGYLMRFNGAEVGIQYRICEKLAQMDLLPFLPQLCHLVVCNEREMPAVEYLLIEACQQSLHIAILTLWYLENYLADYRVNYPKESRLYLRTAKVMRLLHRAIFDCSTNSQSSSKSESSVGVNIVSAGSVLSAVALPTAVNRMRPFLMIESQMMASKAPAVQMGLPDLRRSSMPLPTSQTSQPSRQSKAPSRAASFASIQADPNTAQTDTPTQTQAATALHQVREILLKAAKQINSTVNSTVNAGNVPTLMTVSSTQGISFSIPPPSVPIYYFGEMQFVTSLIDISTRLARVSRPERLKSLMSELALLNHHLPSSLCLPLWCPYGGDCASSANFGDGVKDQNRNHNHDDRNKNDLHNSSLCHHRILRIPPSEAVVLNSAERVPFLMQVEVIESVADEEEFKRLVMKPRHNSQSSTNSNNEPETNRTDSDDNDTLCTADVDDDQAQVRTPLMKTGHQFQDDFTERMRTAAIMLAQLTRQSTKTDPHSTAAHQADIAAIKAKIILEMETLEKERLFDAINDASLGEVEDEQEIIRLDERPLFDREDPSAVVFQEAWDERVTRIRSQSPYGHLPGWRLLSVIVKSGADMRQEQLACQLITKMTDIWRAANLPLWTYSYRVLVAATNGGLIETVPNAISLHSLKKAAYLKNKDTPNYVFSLRNHFIAAYGSPDSASFKEALNNFISSLAAYSLITYLLQIKDRHDGNILISATGHLIHIDFGFMLSNSPGYVGFESAPFKLSHEYVELLGGVHSPPFTALKDLIFSGLLELRKHADALISLVQCMYPHSRLPCFYGGEATLSLLRQRFHLSLTEMQLRQVVDRLVISSAFNVFTKLYDGFQYYSNGIL